MIAKNENALICDFAETYNIYDYKELPPKQAAIFATGLPADSRIYKHLTGQKHDTETLLLSHIADAVNTLLWFQTKDGHRGTNRPASILEAITKEAESKYAEFTSIEAYEAARKKIMES